MAEGRTAQCREHQRQADKRKGTRQERGYNATWLKRAQQRRMAYPVCEWPECDRPSVTVDHIDGDVYNLAWSNLRALCAFHHNSRTGRDQPGGARR